MYVYRICGCISFVYHVYHLRMCIVWFISAPKNNKIKQTRSTEKNTLTMNDAAKPVRSPVMTFDRKFTANSRFKSSAKKIKITHVIISTQLFVLIFPSKLSFSLDVIACRRYFQVAQDNLFMLNGKRGFALFFDCQSYRQEQFLTDIYYPRFCCTNRLTILTLKHFEICSCEVKSSSVCNCILFLNDRANIDYKLVQSTNWYVLI